MMEDRIIFGCRVYVFLKYNWHLVFHPASEGIYLFHKEEVVNSVKDHELDDKVTGILIWTGISIFVI